MNKYKLTYADERKPLKSTITGRNAYTALAGIAVDDYNHSTGDRECFVSVIDKGDSLAVWEDIYDADTPLLIIVVNCGEDEAQCYNYDGNGKEYGTLICEAKLDKSA